MTELTNNLLEDGASLPGTNSSDFPRWQEILQTAVQDPQELFEILELPTEYLPTAYQAAELFPLRVPRGFLSRINPGNIYDPLLRQVLPLQEELIRKEGFTLDPVGDQEAEVVPGLLKKYSGRGLIVTTGSCAVHCRYCFRRHYPYHDLPKGLMSWESVLDEIQDDTSLEEILLSGGDPLNLPDAVFESFVKKIDAIPHVKRLRIHTRLPIVIPERITNRLLNILSDNNLQIIMVVHCNHAHEIDESVRYAMSKLKQVASQLLNQAVLLTGVNDDFKSLYDLSLRLVESDILPYYLHQFDQVQNASHFEVSESTGRELVRQLRTKLPGYAVPRYVKEIPGEPNKVILE